MSQGVCASGLHLIYSPAATQDSILCFKNIFPYLKFLKRNEKGINSYFMWILKISETE